MEFFHVTGAETDCTGATRSQSECAGNSAPLLRESVQLRSSAIVVLTGAAREQPALPIRDQRVSPDVPSTPPNDPPERASRVASAPGQSECERMESCVPQQPIAESSGNSGDAAKAAFGPGQGSGQGLPPLRTAASPLRRRLRFWRGARRVRPRVLDGACADARTGGAAAAAPPGVPWAGHASVLDSLAPADMAAAALVLESSTLVDMAAPALLCPWVTGRPDPGTSSAGALSAAHALPPPAAAAPSMWEAQSTSGGRATTPGRTDMAMAGWGVAEKQPGTHFTQLMPFRSLRIIACAGVSVDDWRDAGTRCPPQGELMRNLPAALVEPGERNCTQRDALALLALAILSRDVC